MSSPHENEALKEMILANFPDFQITSLETLGEGWMSKAILVNQKWVFRFAKSLEASQDLEKEIRILPVLAPHLSLAIPHFEWKGKQKNDLLFVGYQKLPGELLNEKKLASLPQNTQDLLAQQLAKFMDELSHFPLKDARALGVPENDFKQAFTQTYERVKKEVYPILNPKVQLYLKDCFERYLNCPAYFDYKPTLIHADLSPNHYVVDEEHQKLTGIIDFGDLHVGDSDFEYTYLLEDCGEAFTRRVMALRGEVNLEKLLKKVRLFVTFSHVAAILEGIKRGNEGWVEEGIEALRNEINN